MVILVAVRPLKTLFVLLFVSRFFHLSSVKQCFLHSEELKAQAFAVVLKLVSIEAIICLSHEINIDSIYFTLLHTVSHRLGCYLPAYSELFNKSCSIS